MVEALVSQPEDAQNVQHEETTKEETTSVGYGDSTEVETQKKQETESQTTTEEVKPFESMSEVHEALDRLEDYIRNGEWEKANELINDMMGYGRLEDSNIPPQTRKYLSAQLSFIQEHFIQPHLNPSEQQTKVPSTVDTRLYLLAVRTGLEDLTKKSQEELFKGVENLLYHTSSISAGEPTLDIESHGMIRKSTSSILLENSIKYLEQMYFNETNSNIRGSIEFYIERLRRGENPYYVLYDFVQNLGKYYSKENLYERIEKRKERYFKEFQLLTSNNNGTLETYKWNSIIIPVSDIRRAAQDLYEHTFEPWDWIEEFLVKKGIKELWMAFIYGSTEELKDNVEDFVNEQMRRSKEESTPVDAATVGENMAQEYGELLVPMFQEAYPFVNKETQKAIDGYFKALDPAALENDYEKYVQTLKELLKKPDDPEAIGKASQSRPTVWINKELSDSIRSQVDREALPLYDQIELGIKDGSYDIPPAPSAKDIEKTLTFLLPLSPELYNKISSYAEKHSFETPEDFIKNADQRTLSQFYEEIKDMKVYVPTEGKTITIEEYTKHLTPGLESLIFKAKQGDREIQEKIWNYYFGNDGKGTSYSEELALVRGMEAVKEAEEFINRVRNSRRA